MNSEIEATFLETDHDVIRKRLRTLGAKLVSPEKLMRRTVYDYPDLMLDKKAAWVRVRDEADRVTMSFKQRQNESIDGMKEVEFEVSSYDEARKFLEAIGMSAKAEQETKREIWEYGGCEIMLDTWPWIPKYTELEGPDEQTVKAVSEKLELDWSKAMFDSADAVYRRYFNVSRTEISSTPLKFDQPPKDLLTKKKH